MCRSLFWAISPRWPSKVAEQDGAKRGVTTGLTRGYCPKQDRNTPSEKHHQKLLLQILITNVLVLFWFCIEGMGYNAYMGLPLTCTCSLRLCSSEAKESYLLLQELTNEPRPTKQYIKVFFLRQKNVVLRDTLVFTHQVNTCQELRLLRCSNYELRLLRCSNYKSRKCCTIAK